MSCTVFQDEESERGRVLRREERREDGFTQC